VYPANVDLQVLGYLGRALSLELSAVQLYSTQAMLTASWGLTEVAEKFRAESIEEMGHAERIIGRMLALGVAPNASQLRPVRLGQTLQQLLEVDHAFEQELVKLYSDAVAYCTRSGDQDSRLFFKSLLGEEQEHAKELLQWIEKLKQ
jgi:bacterioferritin